MGTPERSAATRVVTVPDDGSAWARLTAARALDRDEWIERHGSGTLRKNRRIGMHARGQYLEERTAWEWGWGWECVPASRVMFGAARTEGDCPAVTEAGWHAERYMSRWPFAADRFQVKYVQVSEPDETRREGIGLVLRETDAPWVPASHVVLTIIAEFDPDARDFRPAVNPW